MLQAAAWLGSRTRGLDWRNQLYLRRELVGELIMIGIDVVEAELDRWRARLLTWRFGPRGGWTRGHGRQRRLLARRHRGAQKTLPVRAQGAALGGRKHGAGLRELRLGEHQLAQAFHDAGRVQATALVQQPRRKVGDRRAMDL